MSRAVGCCDRNHEGIVLVVVIIYVVAGGARISGSEDDVNTKSAAAIGDVVLDRRFRSGPRGKEIVLICGRIAPTRVCNIHPACGEMVQCVGYLARAARRTIRYPEARDACVVCNTHIARAITCSRQHAGNRRAMPVVGCIAVRCAVGRHRVVIEVEQIVRAKVWMVIVDAIVDDADLDA